MKSLASPGSIALFAPLRSVLIVLTLACLGFFPVTVSAQIIGTANDLLDDTTTISSIKLSVRPYVDLTSGPNVGSQENKDILTLTTRPGDADAFYTASQNGKIYRVTDNGSGVGTAIEWFDVNSSVAVEPNNPFHGGLRSIAFHPDFNDSTKSGYGKFYASMLADISGAGSIGTSVGPNDSLVAEWTYNFGTSTVNTSSYRELFRVRNPEFDHPIKQLKFNPLASPGDEDYGLLYIAHGDGSRFNISSGTGQDTTNALGKILRINPLDPDGAGGARYSTPGNTFATDGDANTLAEIYSYGHRNPHTIDFARDNTTGDTYLITAEIGQDNIEEINVIDINIAQNGESNAFDYGWGSREGTFVKVPTVLGYGVGNSALNLPTNDGGNEYIYPALQLDQNDPNDNILFGVAGGPIIGGRYIYGLFAGNGNRPGGQIFSVDFDDLLAQKTTFDTSQGEDVSDLTWIDDHIQHHLEYDHDNNPNTAPQLFDDFGDLLSSDRADFRFGKTNGGDLLVSSKVNGTVYLVSASAFVDPGDFNQDGIVDGADFLLWQRNPSIGNLSDWQNNYSTGAFASSTSVPEPRTLGLAFFLVFITSLERTKHFLS